MFTPNKSRTKVAHAHAERKRRMKLSRSGERIVVRLFDATVWLRNREPFDVVNHSVMFEVKTMLIECKDKKIHISDDSMTRKREWIERYGKEGMLVAVVVDGGECTVYTSELRKSIRISQMRVAYENVKMV